MHARFHAPRTSRTARLIIVWSGIGLLTAGFGTAGIALMTREPDPSILCARGAGLRASTLIIVDPTDAFAEVQRRRVRATIEGERDRLAHGGKLTVLVLGDAAPAEPMEIVSVCNPGRPGDLNPLFETVRTAERRWADAFAEPIDAAIRRASDYPPSANSPIIATIAAGLTRPDFDARVPERRLVLISDLLEHQKGGYSQLAGGDFWKAYSGSELARQGPLDLRGLVVSVDYLVRPQFAAIQGERHRRFWQRLFAEAGAREIVFIGLHPLAAAAAAPPSGGPPQSPMRGGRR